MAKLYFKYGVVNSSKSANALMTIHNYEEQGMKVFVIKPEIDTRDKNIVKSRAINNSRDADLVVHSGDDLYKLIRLSSKPNVFIVDECQFLDVKQIDDLRSVVNDFNIPVICYGLKTDFRTHLFDSSKRLIEVADSIAEIKTVCKCGSKAIFNARVNSDGELIFSGEQIQIGGNDLYVPVCSKCYFNGLRKRGV